MNQILVSKKIYVTREMKIKKRVYKIMYILSIITIVALLIYYVFAEAERNTKEALSQEILEQIEDTTVVEDDAIVIDLNSNPEDEEGVKEIITTDEDESVAPPSTISTSDGASYTIESRLSYDRLGISYPVLADESDSLLKVSLCKYWGPSANSVGNYCVVGHNYKSGKMFGKLSSARNGDIVKLTDLNGNTVEYSVYNMYTVEPTDVSCTSQLTNGKRELTLITCSSHGTRRLVIKCREV